MRPITIPPDIRALDKKAAAFKTEINAIAQNFKRLYAANPDISIVIPAWNEEENILKTLCSLSKTSSRYSIEVIVVDNNSTDATGELATAAGVMCIKETKQGITNARNAGLAAAKGKYIINADADTIYPSAWIDDMVTPLMQNEAIALTYGKFAFIPLEGTSRFSYFIFEHLADFSRTLNRLFKEEAVNVYGFNSACRREQCLAVDGFNHPPGTNEDGFLAMKLRDKGFGKLYCMRRKRSIVWTTDRRILIDGGFRKAFFKRITKEFNRFFKS